MRIFGFDIVRCSKADRMEEEEFKQLATALYDVLCETVMVIERRLTCSPEHDMEFIRVMFQYVEKIGSLLKLYQKNKFSTLNISTSIMRHLSDVRRRSAMMQRIIFSQCFTRENYVTNQAEYEQDTADEEFEESVEHHVMTRNMMLRGLIPVFDAMISILQYDIFRIAYHVDIVRSTYYHRKRFPKGNPEYTVQIFEAESDTESHGRDLYVQ